VSRGAPGAGAVARPGAPRRRLADEAHAYATDPRPSRAATRLTDRLRRLAAPELPTALLDAVLLEGTPTLRDIEALVAAARPVGGPAAGAPSVRLPTRREAEVLALVADGCTTREIATRLVLSECTVRRHVRNACAKLGATSRAAAVAAAVELRLL
jgi:DNA-binding NarL/FixJ family response regulator